MKNSLEEKNLKWKKKKLSKLYCRYKADGIFGKRIEDKLWLKNLESLTTFF